MYRQPKIRLYDNILLKDLGHINVIKCIWSKGYLLNVYIMLNNNLCVMEYDNTYNRLLSQNKRYIGYLEDSFKYYHN